MAQIIRTCNRASTGLLLLAGLFLAQLPGPVTAADIGAFARARAASGNGDAGAASVDFVRALDGGGDGEIIARRAFRDALVAGNDALAERAAAILEKAGQAPPDAFILGYARALAAGDDKAATAALGRLAGGPFGFLVPALKAWAKARPGQADAVVMEDGPRSELARRVLAENIALLLIATGRDEEGLAALRSLVGIDPDAVDLRLAGAELLVAAKRRSDAASILRGARALPADAAARLARPSVSLARFGAARNLMRLSADLAAGDVTPLTISLARAALILDPESERARLQLASALSRINEHDRALAMLGQVKLRGVFGLVSARARVAMLERAGRVPEAISAARQLSVRDGADADDATRLGDVLASNADFKGAAAAYQLAIDRAGPDIGWVRWLQLGSALDQGGDWPRARDALRRAVALGQEEPVVLNYLGYAMLERGEDLPAARALLEKASARAPSDPAITDSLGWALFLAGENERAVTLLERAAMDAPGNATISEHLGDAYWAAGRRYEARYAWQAASVVADGSAKARLAARIENGPPARRQP